MEINKLKDEAKTIKMPEEMRERIAARTEKALMRERSGVKTKRPAVIAAVLAACVCLCAAGAAVGNSGFFRDVTRWDGAVTGTAYEQATEEIAVSAQTEGDVLQVEAIFLAPDRAPYREIDALRIGVWKITDDSGSVAAEGKNTVAADITDGRAEFAIPLEGLKSGAYALQIESFTGESKADQPLGISGAWECAFEMP